MTFAYPKERVTEVINCEKYVLSLKDKEGKLWMKQKFCHIWKEEFEEEFSEKHQKVRDHYYYTGKYRGAAHSICNLRYEILKEIPVMFPDGSK